MTRLRGAVCLCLFLLIAPIQSSHADDLPGQFRLNDGDRVVWIGSTLIEREQRYGYWETLLTSQFPDKNVTFRNLGWSGDTVFGQARAGFDSTADGFRRLKEHVFALKPTVIVVAYGANEAFEGASGLRHFADGLKTLLNTLVPTEARFVLVSPPPQELLEPPLPDPLPHNRNLKLYREVVRLTAQERGCAYLDLYGSLEGLMTSRTMPPLTDNGIHFTAYGYWKTLSMLSSGLRLNQRSSRIQLQAPWVATAAGATVELKPEVQLRFRVQDDVLPLPLPPTDVSAPPLYPTRSIRIDSLAPGQYELKVDGQTVVRADSQQWHDGIRLTRGPEYDQVEQLRQAIIEKNALYFHRWRPQNDTYLFGFRKYEQGQNAREVPEFDPLIAKLEAKIARLRRPVAHEYELIAVREGDK